MENKAPIADSKSTRFYLYPPSFALNSYLLFPFWFACFWALVGTAWRPPLASAGLLALFIVLVAAIEWMTHRFTKKKSPFPMPINESLSADKSVRQQMTRTQTAEGGDRFDGTFLAEFPAEAMTTTVHIPFCPAFEKTPNVQVYPLDESIAALRITSSKPFGMRVDVKRNHPAIAWLRFAVIAEG